MAGDNRITLDLTGVQATLHKTITGIRVAAVSLVQRLKAVSPDRWFLVGFVLLLVAFLFVLIVHPSSVGRGGR